MNQKSDPKERDQLSPSTLRKRRSREARKAAGFRRPEVPLSPAYQKMAEEVIAYTGKKDFPELVKELIKAQYLKVQAHKARHQCCGKCGDPYKTGGSCVFEGDYECLYTHGGRREQEMKP